MKAILVTVIAATLAVGHPVHAQMLTLTKPSPTKPSSNAGSFTSGFGTTVARRTLGDANQNAPVTTKTRRDVASQAKNAPCSSQPVANPAPQSVFIMSDGDRVESDCYLLTADSLRLQQGQTQRTIPLSAVNVSATIAANRERGIDLKIPKNRTEITLGF